MNAPPQEKPRGRLGWIVLLLLAAPVLLLPLSCSTPPEVWDPTPPIKVVVTIAPLESFARAVAGDRAQVKSLCTTSGPHGYQTDFRDARMMDKANIVFSIGLDLDDSFTDALCRIAQPRRVADPLTHVKLGQHLKDKGMVKKMRPHKHAPREKGEDAPEKPHIHGEFDPHVWLGIDEAVFLVGVIRDELSKIDVDHSEQYAKNAETYVKKLTDLHKDGAKILADKQNRRIISFHDAFEYFASSFKIEVAGVIEMTPETKPSPYYLAQLETLCQERPVGAITVEPQYPDSTSAKQLQKALANKKISVPIVSIDPLETAERDELTREGGDWYLARMRKNLEALSRVLK